MSLDELTEGAVLTEEEISKYGLERRDLVIAGVSLYGKGRLRVPLEVTSDGYKVGPMYELPKIG